jgi:hypothetical protein
MAAALVRWLEADLAEHPDEVNAQFLHLLQNAPLTDSLLAKGARESPIPDFPGFRSGDGPRLHDHDPIGSEAERVKNRP